MGFTVTPGELRSAQVFVSDLAADVRTELGDLCDEVTTLLADGWVSTAATGFAAGWHEWHGGADDLLDALGRIGVLLSLTAAQYDASDQEAGVQLDMAGRDL